MHCCWSARKSALYLPENSNGKSILVDVQVFLTLDAQEQQVLFVGRYRLHERM